MLCSCSRAGEASVNPDFMLISDLILGIFTSQWRPVMRSKGGIACNRNAAARDSERMYTSHLPEHDTLRSLSSSGRAVDSSSQIVRMRLYFLPGMYDFA